MTMQLLFFFSKGDALTVAVDARRWMAHCASRLITIPKPGHVGIHLVTNVMFEDA